MGRQKLDRDLSEVPATVIIVTEDEQLLMATVGSLRLDPYCSLRPQFLGLPDANALLSSVENDCRYDRRSRLLRMTDRGTAALYAPNHVYWEVYEHLPRIARFSPVPVDVLRTRFEDEYLRAMRFVKVSTTDIADPQVLAITDPDDVPLGQLAKLIAPCIVFSEDKHLRKPGLAPADWRMAAQFAIDLIESADAQQATGTVAIAPAWVTVKLIKFLGRRTGASPWLVGAVGLVGLSYLLQKPERREAVGKCIVPAMEMLFRMMEAAQAQQEKGLAGLREVLLPAPIAPAVTQQAAIVLARQQEPLLAREVQELIQVHFPVETVPTVTEVRSALTDGTEFVQPERYRWQFGRAAGSWRSM
jgi:hypothetical protein